MSGSFTGAYYVVKSSIGEDIRHHFSGNVGATNAGRLLGKKGFLYALLIDALKVIIPLSIIRYITNGDEVTMLLGALFLILGHVYPVFLRFQGGKGIVAFLASSLVLSPITIGVMAISMGIMYVGSKKYKLSGFLAISTIPVSSYLFGDSLTLSIGLLVLLIFVLCMHVT